MPDLFKDDGHVADEDDKSYYSYDGRPKQTLNFYIFVLGKIPRREMVVEVS